MLFCLLPNCNLIIKLPKSSIFLKKTLPKKPKTHIGHSNYIKRHFLSNFPSFVRHCCINVWKTSIVKCTLTKLFAVIKLVQFSVNLITRLILKWKNQQCWDFPLWNKLECNLHFKEKNENDWGFSLIEKKGIKKDLFW